MSKNPRASFEASLAKKMDQVYPYEQRKLFEQFFRLVQAGLEPNPEVDRPYLFICFHLYGVVFQLDELADRQH